MPFGLLVGDISTFRKYVKNIGRAYQKRSVAMIQLCRLFLEISSGKPDQSDALKSLFDIVETALRSAVDAGKGRSDAADDAFATAEEELDQYAVRYHAREQAVLGDVHDIIEDAAQKDSQIMKTYNRLSTRLGLTKVDTPRSSSLVKVRFQVLSSPTDRHLAPIVTCELGPEVNVSELLWTFSRLPEDQRVTLKQNPHFYLSRDLSDRPLAYDDNFVLKPIKDLKPEKDLVVLILSDRNGQIYFDYEKFSRTYGNIWKPHNTIILKDLQGTLEAANRISPNINGEVCIWQRGGDRPDLHLTDWTEVLDQALSAQDSDWLIRSETSPDEAFDIEVTGGWERCSPITEPEPAPVFGLSNSVTPVPSCEDVFIPLEDDPGLDPGSGSSVPTLDSSDQSLYYSRDDSVLSDATFGSSVEEAQKNEYSLPVEDRVFSGPEVFLPLGSADWVETAVLSSPLVKEAVSSGPEASLPLDGGVQVETSSPPIEDAVSSDPEVAIALGGGVRVETAVPFSLPVKDSSGRELSSPLDGGVQVETTVPSPALTPHVLPELLDSPVENEPDAASSVFVPDRIITPKKTPLLVEAFHVPSQPTPPPLEPPTSLPINDNEPAATDTEHTLDSTAPHTESIHPQLKLAHPPAQVLPSPTPPTRASDAPTPNAPIVLEHPRRQVEPVHLLVQPVLSPPGPLAQSIESKPASRSDVTTSHRLTPVSKLEPQQVEVVRPPESHVTATQRLTLASKPEPQQVEAVRPLESLIAASHRRTPDSTPVPHQVETARHPESHVATTHEFSTPASKPAPQKVEIVRPPESHVTAAQRPTPASKPVPQQIEVVRPPESLVTASHKLTPVLKPAPQQVEASRPPESSVAATHKLTPASKPVPQQVEVVRPPESHVAATQRLTPASKPVPQQIEAVRPPESFVTASHKLTPDLEPTTQPFEAVRPPVQPVQAHRPQVPTSPMNKLAPAGSSAASSALQHARPQIEPIHYPNLHARTSDALSPPFRGNPATASSAPAPDRVAAVSESTRLRVEMAHRPVPLVPAPRSLTSHAGSQPAPAGGVSTPSVRLPIQHTVPKSPAPVGHASAAEYTTLTPSGTRSVATAVPRQVQVIHATPRSSALYARSGPVPVGSVPVPNMIRPPSERTRPQVGTARPPTAVPRVQPASRVAPIGNTPAGSASTPDTKEVSRNRIKSHPRKMVTPIGQRRSVVAPAPMVTQPTAPPSRQPQSPPVQQTTTRLAPQNGNSLAQRGVSTGIPSTSSLPEPTARVAPTAHAVPLAPSAAPPAMLRGAALPTHVGNTTSVPSPIMPQSGPRISNADDPTGRSRRSIVVSEQMPPRPAVRPIALPPTQPEQSATNSPPNRSISTPIARQDRATAVLPDSSHQKRVDPVSVPGGWAESKPDSTDTAIPIRASKVPNAGASVGNATVLPTPVASNASSPTPLTSKAKDPIREPRPLTALPEPIAPQVTVRLSAQLVTLPKQQAEPTTTSLQNSEPVAITRRGETTKPSYSGSRTVTSGVVPGAVTPQGEPKLHRTPTTVLLRQETVTEPALRRSAQRITSRIKTKDLINRHKPQITNDVRPPSMAQSPGTPTLSRSPMLDSSQLTPSKLDPNRIDSGIDLWDYSESPRARSDRQRGSNNPANRYSRGPVDRAAASMFPTNLPAVPERAGGKEGSRPPLPHKESTASISKSPGRPASMHRRPSSPPEPVQAHPPNTTESLHAESPASTSSGRGGAFLTRKPQASFQSAMQGSYLENSTPPRSSTPSSMTHATTTATSTQVTLLTPASSFPQLSSLSTKAEPRSWFRRNVIDPFKTKLGLAPE